MASVEERILELAQENFDREPDWDLPFRDSDVSSMDAVAFIKVLGQEFDIEIPPEQLAQADNLRKLAKLVTDAVG